ncbi:NAD-dependent deacetylase [Roseimicrobium gellanilyticum]|uniref:NAD-dependent protein deacylase n=2 Tax=Roseimicrobium gellanilyticum TaxID=748857 RepID=A0A366HIB3_9BACT|nr:NAD-dependent deacetylase [Roseimicrobium gellanilyticum]
MPVQNQFSMSTAPHIVILTGAGISAESGVPTFRDANGLWENHRIEEVATLEAFGRNRALVHRFYNLRRAALATVEPNPAHVALAKLQREYPGRVTLITQNVDDLHERGGSREVIHMHGELLKARCAHCDDVISWGLDLNETLQCGACRRTGWMRPHIVWFGEVPMRMEEIQSVLNEVDIFIAVGTSGHVYPAAGFVQVAKFAGARTIEVNMDVTAMSDAFQEHLVGKAGKKVPALVEELLGNARG